MDTLETLRNAYRRPDTGGVFYSANSVPTASPRLNALPAWDWTPAPTRGYPGNYTCMFPHALGCRAVEVDGRPWVERLIRDPAQIKDLPRPDPYDGMPGAVLRAMAVLAATLPPGERIRAPDVQSPLGVAELMWDESFYTALYDEPEAVHDLLERITDYQIAFIREFRRVAGERLNPCGFPLVWGEGAGTMIADDTLSLLSPAMHAEFSLPYVNRIARAVGPVAYHSCTWREPYFDNLHRVENVMLYNWNPGDSVDFAVLAREFAGCAVIAPHLVPGMHREKGALAWGRHFVDEFDFFRYAVESSPPNATLYWWFGKGVAERADLVERLYDYLNANGHAPAHP